MPKFVTKNANATKSLGRLLAKELCGGELICLNGNLGAGKTTLTQGLLKGLGAKGPYTSPTFVVMKYYEVDSHKSAIRNVYHIDAYRIGPEDLLDLGWKELISSIENIIVIEWSDRVKKIIPRNALKINFKWLDEKTRSIQIT